jgi:hypothetical protein
MYFSTIKIKNHKSVLSFPPKLERKHLFQQLLNLYGKSLGKKTAVAITCQRIRF